jgi:hypothetical protein
MEERMRSLEQHVERLESNVTETRTEIRSARNDLRAGMRELGTEIASTVHQQFRNQQARDHESISRLKSDICWKLEFSVLGRVAAGMVLVTLLFFGCSDLKWRLKQVENEVRYLRTDSSRSFN